MIQIDDIQTPVIKIATSWGGVIVTSWNEIAAILASIYTLILISEWMWKKILRPFLERKGWLKKQYRRKDD